MEINHTANILATYERASASDMLEGLSWYPTAHDIASEASNVATGAGIIAALSPRMPWHRNIKLARVAFGAPLTGGALKRSVNSANRILMGDAPLQVLSGLKTRAFYHNIRFPETSKMVTVDTHAIKIAGVDKDSVTPKQYGIIANAYRDAAKHIGLLPSDVQAVTWTTYRREQDLWTAKA